MQAISIDIEGGSVEWILSKDVATRLGSLDEERRKAILKLLSDAIKWHFTLLFVATRMGQKTEDALKIITTGAKMTASGVACMIPSKRSKTIKTNQHQ